MTVRCPDCGDVYEDGTQFCDQCGTELSQPEPTVSATAPVEEQAPEVAELPLVTAPAVAKLVVTRGTHVGREYALFPGENVIGRWDDDEGYTPHIDLDDEDTERLVHRRHAVIRFDGKQWWLEHLKEPPSNPTRIVRAGRLELGKPILLENGDDIVVGKVILKFMIG